MAKSDAEMFGLPPGYEEELAEGGAEIFEYWPENEDALCAFLLCQTQWVYHGMGGRIGLNYSGVELVIARHKFDNPDEVFCDVQRMEFAALAVLNS